MVVLLALGVAQGCGNRAQSPAAPAMCANAVLTASRDIWPGWSGSGEWIYYRHGARGPSDSNCVAKVDTAGLVVRYMRVPDGAGEFAYRADEMGAVFAVGLELFEATYANGAVRQLTVGGRGCHWPRIDGLGKFACYSRVLHPASEPDSTAGVRILNLQTGTDRALMRTATKPWAARGPVCWSPSSDRVAFFDADTLANGASRLVIVKLSGALELSIGWSVGVPGGIEWLSDGSGWLFDSTSNECPNDESARRTFVMRPTGEVQPQGVELGDSRVFNGYPFALSPDARWSAHVGLSSGAGVIVMTDVSSGTLRLLTNP